MSGKTRQELEPLIGLSNRSALRHSITTSKLGTVNLRDPLRRGEALEPLFRQALAEKPREHQLLQMQVGGLRALSQVGG